MPELDFLSFCVGFFAPSLLWLVWSALEFRAKGEQTQGKCFVAFVKAEDLNKIFRAKDEEKKAEQGEAEQGSRL